MTVPLLDTFQEAAGMASTGEARTLLAKFGLGAEPMSSDRPARCHRASAPEPAWPCCRVGV